MPHCNHVHKELLKLGLILDYYGMSTSPIAAVEQGHHLIIDGTLKTNESTVNSLFDFSRKARLKGSREISVL